MVIWLSDWLAVYPTWLAIGFVPACMSDQLMARHDAECGMSDILAIPFELGTFSQRTLSQRTFSHYLQQGHLANIQTFYYIYVSFHYKYSCFNKYKAHCM